MGIYRFILAALVATSHAQGHVFGYNPGVVAVISFYILSGYVMAILIRRHYAEPRHIPMFYLDRAARLFPQYLLYCLISLALIPMVPIDSPFVRGLDGWSAFLNMLMLPLNYYMFGLENAMVFPQGWSLGLELSFYLVVPFLLIFSKSRATTMWIFSASVVVFLLAYRGTLNTDWFGYRFLPGTFFMFLVGTALIEKTRFPKDLHAMVAIGALALLVFAYWNQAYLALHYNKEVLAGLLIGTVVVRMLQRLPFSALDAFLGNLSYGLFLNHFLVIWLLQYGLGWGSAFGWKQMVCMLAISAGTAWLSYLLVERPALRWRHHIRYRNDASSREKTLRGSDCRGPSSD